MNSKQRLANLDKILGALYRQLGDFQLAIAEGISRDQRFYLNEKINNEIKPSIRQHEEEYWSILAKEALFCEVIEKEASDAIVEVVQKVELIQSQPHNYPNELMQKLQEILDKLNEPQTPAAAAKLKAALPLVPGIMSYEVELDTENSLTRVFDRIKKLFKKAIDEKEKKTHK